MPVLTPGVITDEAIVDGELEEVYAFMMDFSNSQYWDPGVVTAVAGQQGAVKVGSTYSLVVEFNGKRSTMDYEVKAIEPNKSIHIDGDSSMITANDVMIFSVPEAGKVKIDYSATIKLKGCAKIFVRLLKSKFNELGRTAMKGIVDHFAAHGPHPNPNKIAA